MNGLALHYAVNSFWEARTFVERCVRAGIARCVSPERDARCEDAATHIHWQDQAEWYLCCNRHAVGGPQWTGSTMWRALSVEVCVIADLAQAWLADVPREEQERISLEVYER